MMEMTTFYAALKIMGMGMMGIFLFMLLFSAIIYILRKAFPPKKETPADNT